MNMTLSAKNHIISEKKRQIRERTLGHTKAGLERENREALLPRVQRLRNLWEKEHMGNF